MDLLNWVLVLQWMLQDKAAHTSGLGAELSIGGYKVGIPANPYGLSRNNQGNSLGWGMPQ